VPRSGSARQCSPTTGSATPHSKQRRHQVSPRTIATVFVGTILTALASCGGAGGMTGSEGADSTSNDSSNDASDAGSDSTGEHGRPIEDLAQDCFAASCDPADLGSCIGAGGCVVPMVECATSHEDDGGSSPGRCAPPARSRHLLHESCGTYDVSSTQTCSVGLTCWGPRGALMGVCHEWCADTGTNSGTCAESSDVCLQLTPPPHVSLGGYCVARCDPTNAAPCPETAQSICTDVGHATTVFVEDAGFSGSTFVCVPSDDGERVEREPCEPTLQHHDPVSGQAGDPLAARCAPGLTCAYHQFFDQPAPSLQCLRVCDAPDDCAPTEACVSSQAFTEAVGAPIGVCEAM
jgi:hypothetical protein